MIMRGGSSRKNELKKKKQIEILRKVKELFQPDKSTLERAREEDEGI